MEQGIDRTLPKLNELSTILQLLCGFYFFLSFFEAYTSVFTGPITRYLIFIISFMFLYSYHGRIRKSIYVFFILLWFLFKLLSIIWSNQSNDDVSRTLLSQIGVVLLFVSLCSQLQSRKLLVLFIQVNYWCSLLFGVLTLLFHKSYISDVYASRQVLTLFGTQNDPNNCAVFLCIGISIAVYSLVTEKRMKILSIAVVLINSYGVLLSGSRMGFVLLGVIASTVVLIPNTKDKFIIKTFIYKLFIISLVFAIGRWIINRYLPVASLERMLAFEEYSDGSGRMLKWSLAIEGFKERPVFGWGWGGYDFVGSVIHNTYLTMLCDVGLVGFLLFIIPLIQLAFYLLKNKCQLGILLLVNGLVSGFFLDAINKRFFWNTILIAVLLVEYYEKNDAGLSIWPMKAKQDDHLPRERKKRMDIVSTAEVYDG